MTNLVKLNLARNCLKYIIKAYGIKEIFIPYYICPVVRLAAKEASCRVRFYHIDETFMPVCEFHPDDYIVYVNYFGLCTNNCKILAHKYKNLIVDNTQGFYNGQIGLASFNSLRKFFNVQNGAYLYINKKLNENFLQDDLILNPVMFHKNESLFIQNELKLNKEKNIKTISNTVEIQMKNIDFNTDKSQRIELYKIYSQNFDKFNRIKLSISNTDIPYCYPFTPEDDILLNLKNLSVLNLWGNIPKLFYEFRFLNNVAAFPVNDIIFAEKIIQTVNKKRPDKLHSIRSVT